VVRQRRCPVSSAQSGRLSWAWAVACCTVMPWLRPGGCTSLEGTGKRLVGGGGGSGGSGDQPGRLHAPSSAAHPVSLLKHDAACQEEAAHPRSRRFAAKLRCRPCRRPCSCLRIQTRCCWSVRKRWSFARQRWLGAFGLPVAVGLCNSVCVCRNDKVMLALSRGDGLMHSGGKRGSI
jgi:hypothetical protein